MSPEFWSRLRPSRKRGEPLYEQVARGLWHLIQTGQLEPGTPIPPERRLAQLLGVSRLTVRKALEGLVAQGALLRRPGAGTFVARRVEQPLSHLSGFSEDMRARGMEPGSRWLRKEVGQASPEEALALALSPGKGVVRLVRVRTADGVPMALEAAVLPLEVLPNPEEVGDSLYAYLEVQGLRPTRALQRLRAVGAPLEVARLLGLTPGEPVLFIQRVSFLRGQPVEFTRSYYRGDLYDFVAELRGEP